METPKEINMKSIEKYDGYFVTKEGLIYSAKTNRYLKFSYDKQGYARVGLSVGNYKTKTIKVHRLVAETFIDNPQSKGDVNHIDGVKSNNHVDNLEWNTRSENIIHAYNNGLKTNTEKQIKGVKERFSKKVFDTKTGIIYKSLRQASIELGISYHILKNNFRPNKINKTTLIWMQK